MSPDWRQLSLMIEGSLSAEARYGPFCSLLSLLLCIRRPPIFSLNGLGKISVLYTEKYGTSFSHYTTQFTTSVEGIQECTLKIP